MGLIAPGRNVVCIRDVRCQWCGVGHATERSIYMCEALEESNFLHRLLCETEGCDGFVLVLKGKTCCYCACCFKPLDDGDTSLVADEEHDPMVITEPEKVDA